MSQHKHFSPMSLRTIAVQFLSGLLLLLLLLSLLLLLLLPKLAATQPFISESIAFMTMPWGCFLSQRTPLYSASSVFIRALLGQPQTQSNVLLQSELRDFSCFILSLFIVFLLSRNLSSMGCNPGAVWISARGVLGFLGSKCQLLAQILGGTSDGTHGRPECSFQFLAWACVVLIIVGMYGTQQRLEEILPFKEIILKYSNCSFVHNTHTVNYFGILFTLKFFM